MTMKLGNVVIISDEPDKKCTRCGKLTDCRDILGNGKQVCFDCATPQEQDQYCETLFSPTPEKKGIN